MKRLFAWYSVVVVPLGPALALALALPMAAQAQTTVLAYQGNVMTGTSTVSPPDCPPNCGGILGKVLPPIPTLGAFSADITLSGSLAKHDLAITGWTVDVTLNNGTIVSLDNLGGGLDTFVTQSTLPYPPTTTATGVCAIPSSADEQGCVNLTTKGYAVTGATFDLFTQVAKGDNFSLIIGPNGDSFSYSTYAPSDTCSGGFAGDFVSTYVGPPGYVPCSASVSNSKRGTWINVTRGVPEPGTLGLLGLGLAGVGFARRKHKN